jgi:hypothetical protein
MLGEPLLMLWSDLPLNPEGQQEAAFEYASRVFGSERHAVAWFTSRDPNVLAGSCVISEACRTREGFREAVIELSRISRLSPAALRGDNLRGDNDPRSALVADARH